MLKYWNGAKRILTTSALPLEATSLPAAFARAGGSSCGVPSLHGGGAALVPDAVCVRWQKGCDVWRGRLARGVQGPTGQGS